MNMRLGRFGKQESALAVSLAALISGTFSVNVGDTFAHGNVCYAATAAGALLSLLLLRLLFGAMARFGAEADLLFCQAAAGVGFRHCHGLLLRRALFRHPLTSRRFPIVLK